MNDPQFRQALAEALRLDVRTMLRLAGYEVNEAFRSEAAERVASMIEPAAARKAGISGAPGGAAGQRLTFCTEAGVLKEPDSAKNRANLAICPFSGVKSPA